MKDKELKLEEVEVSHTLGGTGEGGAQGAEVSLLSDTHKRIGLVDRNGTLDKDLNTQHGDLLSY